MKYVFLALLAFSTGGCNSCTRQFGGSSKLDLPCGSKLVNITWKDSSLWYVTRPMRASDIPQIYTFQEDSQFGAMEGTVIVTECQ